MCIPPSTQKPNIRTVVKMIPFEIPSSSSAATLPKRHLHFIYKNIMDLTLTSAHSWHREKLPISRTKNSNTTTTQKSMRIVIWRTKTLCYTGEFFSRFKDVHKKSFRSWPRMWVNTCLKCEGCSEKFRVQDLQNQSEQTKNRFSNVLYL